VHIIVGWLNETFRKVIPKQESGLVQESETTRRMVNSDSDSDEFPFPEFKTNGEFVDPENKRIRNTNDVGVQFPELISPRNEQRLPESETNSEPEPIQQVSELNARRSNNLRRVQTGMVRKMNMVKMLRSVRRFIGGARYHSRADRRGLGN